MPFPLASNDVVELTVKATYQSQVVLNVWHYAYFNPSVTIPDGTAEVDDLCSQFDSLFYQSAVFGILPQSVVGYSINEMKAQVVHPVRQHFITHNPATSAGQVAGEGIPSNTDLVIAIRTDVAGRGKSGNKRFTAIPITHMTGNTFDAVTVGFWQTLANHFGDAFTALTAPGIWKPIVWSKRRALDRRGMVGTIARNEVRIDRSRTKGIGI